VKEIIILILSVVSFGVLIAAMLYFMNEFVFEPMKIREHVKKYKNLHSDIALHYKWEYGNGTTRELDLQYHVVSLDRTLYLANLMAWRTDLKYADEQYQTYLRLYSKVSKLIMIYQEHGHEKDFHIYNYDI
jgi:hypothetical protein